LTDMPLTDITDFFKRSGKIGCHIAVKPPHTFHIVKSKPNGVVTAMVPVSKSETRMNGGFFVFKKEIFNYFKEGEDLVDGAFQRLIQKRELVNYKYDGFWVNMDTYKDKQKLDELALNDKAPWEIWKKHQS